MLEIEVKVKVQLDEMEISLRNLGFLKGTVVYEKDTYYNGRQVDLKKEDKALRIREHRDLESNVTTYVLNFKGPKLDDSTMTREETQFEVPSLEIGETVLNGLGFFATDGVEKVRTHYLKEVVTCCLDDVTGLGEFLEIEVIAEEKGYDAAIEKIKGLLGRLGLSMRDTVRESYLSMAQRF